MTFLWPDLLWLLLLVPLLAAAYVLILRRKRKAALRYASLSMVRQAMGAGQGVRRHLPAALFLLALAALLLAMARPATVMTMPARYETVILAMDVSGSMRATDVSPDRLTASQEAAKAFVNGQPRTTRIGVVAFAGTASLVQTPTQSREEVISAIDRFQLQRATAIGSGILVSLKAVFPDLEVDLRAQNPHRDAAKSALSRPLGTPDRQMLKPVAPGSYGSAVIVLLTDGQNTSGPNPIEAAKIAADRGVRVYTVGVGTPNGEIMVGDGWSMRVRLDEETLKQVSGITHAEYFYAGSGVDLKNIYRTLNSRFTLEKKETEVTALFSAAGTLLALLSALLSLIWFNRIF